MGRSAQHIGLNGRAEALLDYLFGKEGWPTKRYQHVEGMFGEEDGFWLRQWVVPKGPLNEYDKDVLLREVVQEEPWSSGPMFFTCLELVLKNQVINTDGSLGDSVERLTEWMLDPMVKYDCEFGCTQYDYASGRYWV
jgi:hypothetical protein